MRWVYLAAFVVILSFLSNAAGFEDTNTILTASKKNGDIKIDGFSVENDWNLTAPLVVEVQDGSIGSVEVSIKALYDTENIYFFITWPDSSESTEKSIWVYDGVNWSSSGEEDRFAVIWNIDNSIQGFNIGGCAMLCHGDRMHTNAPGEKGDLWQWKASRTNPLGYMDDEWIDNNVLKGYTEVATEAALKGDSSQSIYTTGYVRNINDNKSAPRYLNPQQLQSGTFSKLLLADLESGLLVEVEGLDLDERRAIVPGYLLSRPDGSRGNIDARGMWADGMWNLEIKRKLDTGNPDDVQFDITNTYRFGIAVMDNTGGFEAYDKGHSFDLGARTLEFGGIGSEEVTQIALVSDYILTAKTHLQDGHNGLAISDVNNGIAIFSAISNSLSSKDPELYLEIKNSFTQSKRNPTTENLDVLSSGIDSMLLTLQGKRTPPEPSFKLKLLVIWGKIQLYTFIFLAFFAIYPIYKTVKVGRRPQLRYMAIFLLIVTSPILLEGLGRLGVLLGIKELQSLSFTTSELITLVWTVGMIIALGVARAAFLEIDTTIGSLEDKSHQLEENVHEIQVLKDFNENIILNAPVGVLATDEKGIINLINPKALEMLGLENKEKAIGKDLNELFLVKRMGWNRHFKKALKGKPFLLMDEKYMLSPTKTFYSSLQCTPLIGKKNNLEGILVLLEDVSERKRMEEKFSQTEKLAATGKLAATIAHEINNPLTGIINCVNILMDELNGKDPNRKYLEMADEELNRIAKIVRRLLDTYRPSIEQTEPFSINNALKEVLDLMKTQLMKQNINVQADLYPDLPKVSGSRQQLKEVLLNILINAQEAMPEGGIVFVETDIKNKMISIKIKDTGPGIPNEDILKVFDPFYTSKKDGKGTGLGLSVSYGIIKAHKGTITASSSLGEGTTITIELPIYEEVELERVYQED